MKNKSTRRGFTLIELLIVVLIIGILAAIAVPQYQRAVDKSRLATVKHLLTSVEEAQRLYYMENGIYSASLEDLSISLSGCRLNGDKTTCIYPWGYCYLACDPLGKCGGCLLNVEKDGWVIFMGHKGWVKKFNCLASIGSARAYKLCQADTGKTEPNSQSQGYDVFIY